MAMLIAESWDGYGGSNTASSGRWGAGAVFTTTHAKTGAYAYGGTGASGVANSRGFGNLTSNLTFHFGIWIYWTGTIPAQNGLVFGLPSFTPYSGSNAQCGISADTSHQLRMERSFNGGTVLQTSSPCLNTNAWNYITGSILMGNSGTWDIYCNGVQVLNGSGDTQAQATAQVGGIHLGTGTTYWADSIWVMDPTGSFNNAHPGLTGQHIVSCFQPSGAGATTGLTPLSGANYTNVDEAPPNSDTDYNSGASNALDTYAVDWSPLASHGILGLIISTFARSVSGSQACHQVLRMGGTDNHYSNNPTSGLALDYTALSTAEIGWQAVGTTLRLSQIYADVLSTANIVDLTASVSDAITVTDNFGNRVITTLLRSVSDAVTVVDAITAALVLSRLTVSVSEAITLAETISTRLATALRLSLFDTLTITEFHNEVYPGRIKANVNDSVSLTENVSTRYGTALRQALSEVITVAELETLVYSLQQQLQTEVITVEEFLRVSLSPLVARLVDRITVRDFVFQPAVTKLTVNVRDLIHVTEGRFYAVSAAPGTVTGVGPEPPPLANRDDYWVVGI